MISRRFVLFACTFAFLAVGWRAPMSTPAVRVDFGKIYLTPTHLYVGEMYQGINIYDVRDPAAIRSVGYVPLEGNLDVVGTGTVMYADNYEDLLVFDCTDPAAPVVIDSLQKVFTGHTKPQPIVYGVSENTYGGSSGCSGSDGCGTAPPQYDMTDGGRNTGGSGGASGQSGSMSRFAIVDHYLYCIDVANLVVFDIIQPRAPKLVGKVSIGFGIETLFPYENYLFIGSQTGMFIFDARDVRLPIKVSEFRHARACDPVVVEGERAYVTLRNGTRCGESENELHIVDIADVKSPMLIASHGLDGPQGLSVRNSMVIVCDANDVKILDVRNEKAPVPVSSIPVANGYDVIWSGDLLVIVAPNGLYLYDVADPAQPRQLAMVSNVRKAA